MPPGLPVACGGGDRHCVARLRAEKHRSGAQEHARQAQLVGELAVVVPAGTPAGEHLNGQRSKSGRLPCMPAALWQLRNLES